MKNAMPTKASIMLILLIVMLSSCATHSGQSSSSALNQVNSIHEELHVEEELPDHSLSDADTMINQIKSGDFSSVRTIDREKPDEKLIDILNHCAQTAEWAEYTLHNNEKRGLILQGDRLSDSDLRRIDALFVVDDIEATLIFTSMGMQSTSFYFVSKNGQIIYNYSFYGLEACNNYALYRIDDNLSFVKDYGLSVYRTQDWAIEEARKNGTYDDIVEKFPRWAKAGTYYYMDGTDEEMDEKQFLEMFEKMTGYSFYDDYPLKPGWFNWDD